MVDLYGGSPPVHYANIVKGECNAKQKTLFFEFALPSRLLYYVNIVKGECTAKQKNTFFEFALPSRLLYYVNIVKGGCIAKQKITFFEFVLPSRLLILSIAMRIYTIFAEDRKRIGISCCLCVHIKNMNFCLTLW